MYFKLLGGIHPLTVLSHRVVGSLLILLAMIAVLRQWDQVQKVIWSKRLLGLMGVSTLMIAVNWIVFIYCVASGQVLQSSLGYFLNPLVTAILSMIFLSERLRTGQWVALVMAFGGVVVMIAGVGEVPTLAILLAVSFGFYGVARKTAKVAAVPGLAVETALLLPGALVYLVWVFAMGGWASVLAWPGATGVGDDVRQFGWLWLLLAGLITTIPLLAFNAAATRLRLTTLGFLQYLGPTGQFILAVLFFGERFTTMHAAAFGMIWAGVLLYSAESVLHFRKAAADSRRLAEGQ